jgi:hypothetical protein
MPRKLASGCWDMIALVEGSAVDVKKFHGTGNSMAKSRLSRELFRERFKGRENNKVARKPADFVAGEETRAEDLPDCRSFLGANAEMVAGQLIRLLLFVRGVNARRRRVIGAVAPSLDVDVVVVAPLSTLAGWCCGLKGRGELQV